jgi:hypothetical protein
MLDSLRRQVHYAKIELRYDIFGRERAHVFRKRAWKLCTRSLCYDWREYVRIAAEETGADYSYVLSQPELGYIKQP